MKRQLIKVYLPHECCLATYGLVLGTVSNNTFCVCGIVPISDSEDVNRVAALYSSKPVQVIGMWADERYTHSCGDTFLVNQLTENCRMAALLSLTRLFNSGTIKCEIVGRNEISVFLIIFNCDEIVKCWSLLEDKLRPDLSTLVEGIQQLTCDSQDSQTCDSQTCDSHDSAMVRWFFESPSDIAYTSHMYETLTKIEEFTESITSSICRYVGINAICSSRLLPVSVQQIQHKYHQFKDCLHQSDTTSSTHRCKNAEVGGAVDVFLGICLMLWLTSYGRHEQISESIITSAESLVVELQRLLVWIMGVPAGLKLNSRLDQFLGKFFTYHIHLWTGYLHLLKPVLGRLLWYGSLFGCCGFSVQLGLAHDLVSMMTLHIYCFYVYAARLYSLEVCALSSLFRLFRGKKWNVLRKRVDSASYDIDQLFIGTLLFTVLLFILPTIIVYYLAFTSLRLLVLIIQGSLNQLIYIVNTAPIASLFLRMSNSTMTVGDIKFLIGQAYSDPDQTVLFLQVVQMSVTDIYRRYKRHLYGSTKPYTWSNFIRRLIDGHIVYPWIQADDTE